MISLAFTVALSLTSAAAPDATIRRFTLIAGANDGGGERVMLRYAASDARHVATVMQELGGVSGADTTVIEDPTSDQLLKAFDTLRAQVEKAHRTGAARAEVLFYYSGHSDETGLLLKGDRVTYATLRTQLDSLGAEVRIAVLDSCASGAMNRLKGGVARPSFLVDASSSLSGHAFLTSASEDESAQESEQLKASIFTHFFVSGLRGAADASRDGQVTLGEAYQYAFNETLARTASTRSGPQRPSYDIALAGRGDLVLTDVRASSARLVLDSTVGGRVYVLNGSGGLVVEVAKLKGKPTELGLEPGEYRVVIDGGDRAVGEARIALAKGEQRSVGANGLAATTLEATVLRGGAPRGHLPVNLSFVYPLGLSGLQTPAPRVNVDVGLLGSRVGAVDGAHFSSVAGWVDEAVTGAALSGVFLKTGGLTGFAASGAVLVNAGDMTGVQLSVVNISKGRMQGVQTGVVNLSVGDTHGFQLGVSNISTGPTYGAQAGVTNVAIGEVHASQFGLLNFGGDVGGAQVGLVNIASNVEVTQVGLLNIAKTSKRPIGLINVITEGSYKFAAWSNETSVANVGFKMGSEHVYALLTAGVNPRADAGKPMYSVGLGLGIRGLWGRWYGELETSYDQLALNARGWNETAWLLGLRLNVGFQLFSKFAIFAGPQMTVVISTLGDQQLSLLSPYGIWAGSSVRLVPGVVAGVQFL